MYLYVWINVVKRYNEIYNRVKQLQEEIVYICFVEYKIEIRIDIMSSCNNVSLSWCCDVLVLIWLNGGYGQFLVRSLVLYIIVLNGQFERYIYI